MAAEDPLELYEYASENRLTYTKAMEEYSKVFSISSHYSYFYEYLGRLITEDDSVRYRTVEECCEDPRDLCRPSDHHAGGGIS